MFQSQWSLFLSHMTNNADHMVMLWTDTVNQLWCRAGSVAGILPGCCMLPRTAPISCSTMSSSWRSPLFILPVVELPWPTTVWPLIIGLVIGGACLMCWIGLVASYQAHMAGASNSLAGVSVTVPFSYQVPEYIQYWFLPCCMECRRGLAMRILSVRPSNAWNVTKWKKNQSRFLYHTKEHLA